jgi:hypothetical protein
VWPVQVACRVLVGHYGAIVDHRQRNDERVSGAAPAALTDKPGMEIQNPRGGLLYREFERNEQVALGVCPLLGSVVAPSQLAPHLIH